MPDGQVEPFLGQVDEAVAQVQLQPDLGIAREEGHERGRNVLAAQRHRGSDANQPARIARQVADTRERLLDALEAESGLRLKSAFEHEFHYSGAAPRLGDAYSLDAMRLQGAFAQRLMQALDENGIDPEMVLPEYGPQQFEVTCRPALGLKSADDAVRLREITRSIARALGQKATFSPVMGAGAVGNGVRRCVQARRLQAEPAGHHRPRLVHALPGLARERLHADGVAEGAEQLALHRHQRLRLLAAAKLVGLGQ